MKTKLFFVLLLLGAAPLWSQVEPGASGGTTSSDDDSRMTIPPAASGEAYPTTGTAEEQSNFLSGGLTFITAYDDNLFVGGGMKPVGDMSYSILPTIMLDQTTPRQHRALTYSAGFLFYQPTSALNSVEQNASVNYRYRFSPSTSISAFDSFQQSSNVFTQSSPLSGALGAGAGGSEGVIVIAPYANQYSNSANVVASYQFGQDGMIGATGNSTVLNYPNLSEVPGLYNSMAEGGSGFYTRRLTGSQYIGVTYKYSNYTTQPVDSNTETHTISVFYSTHLNRSLSVSVSAGPQYYRSSQGGEPSTQSWNPSATASASWRNDHTSLSVYYSRSVYGVGGLLGTYETNSTGASARWQMERTWSIGSSAIYSNSKNVSSFDAVSSPGGDAISGTVSLQHRLAEHMDAELGYARLHQNYNSIAFVSTAPNSDRIYISVSYQFTRPLGR